MPARIVDIAATALKKAASAEFASDDHSHLNHRHGLAPLVFLVDSKDEFANLNSHRGQAFLHMPISSFESTQLELPRSPVRLANRIPRDS
jgi:hypothetical protein